MRLRHVLAFLAAGIAAALTPYAGRSTSAGCATSIARCPLQGCSTSPSAYAPLDRELNTRKNRALNNPSPSKLPATRIGPFEVSDLLNPAVLPVHHPGHGNPKDVRDGNNGRGAWTGNDGAAQAVRAMENHQTMVTGYILRAKAADPESCNCDISDPRIQDIHLNIVQTANEGSDPHALLAQSAIVEITHWIRDPSWTVAALNALSLSNGSGSVTPRVAIYGALTYDNLHWDMMPGSGSNIAGSRGTLWEVHPVTRIDVEVNGRWVRFNLQTSPSLLGNAAARRAFTNARYAGWSADQIRTLDALMSRS